MIVRYEDILVASILLLPLAEQIKLGAGLTDDGQSMIKKVPSMWFRRTVHVLFVGLLYLSIYFRGTDL